MARKPAKSASTLSLASIVEATQDANRGFLYVDLDAAKELVDNGDIEVNAAMTEDGTGKVAARATEKGIKSMNATTPTASAEAPASSPSFEIETVPTAIATAKKSSTGRSSIYPFDKLAAPSKDADDKPVHQGFFIPATDDRPEPWKQLASTVSTASKRYAKKTGEEEYTTGDGETKTKNVYEYARKFKITEGEKTVDGKTVKGAWVHRTV